MVSERPIEGHGSARAGDDDAITEVIASAHADDTLGTAEPGAAQERSRGWFRRWMAGAAVLVAVGGIYLIDLASTRGEIERRTVIAGVDVGGRTPEQARSDLGASIEQRYAATLTLDVHGKTVSLLPSAAGLGADVDAAISAAGTASASPIARFSSFFRSASVPLQVSVDEAALTSWVKARAAETDVNAVQAVLRLDGTTVTSTAPVTGRTLQVGASVAAISRAWTDGGPDAVGGLALPFTNTAVRATGRDTTAAVGQVKQYLSGPVTVSAGDFTAQITVTQIAAAMTIEPSGTGFDIAVDVGALRDPLTARIEATQTKPRSASLGLVDGKPTVTDGITGRTVVWDSSERALAAALTARGDRTWKVVYTSTDPDLTTAQAKAFGIKEKISEFTTRDFSYASGQNVKVLAARMNGVIIKSGETFSLNDFTGPRGTAQGYIESGIIDNGRPDKAIGGGLSQFTTTLYNATYFAGLQQIEHQPHSYYISRYPPGREATIFIPSIDLVFKNDYPTAVLVETIWTESSITVRLYGTKQVDVQSVTGERRNLTAPPTTTIPYGQSCNAADGTQGFTIDDTRIIRNLAGKELAREKQSTVYNGQYRVICEPAPQPPVVTPAPITPAPTAPGSAPTSGATRPTVKPSSN